MKEPQQEKRGVKFLSRISKSGDKLFINIPLEMHEEIAPLRHKLLAITMKEVEY